MMMHNENKYDLTYMELCQRCRLDFNQLKNEKENIREINTNLMDLQKQLQQKEFEDDIEYLEQLKEYQLLNTTYVQNEKRIGELKIEEFNQNSIELNELQSKLTNMGDIYDEKHIQELEEGLKLINEINL